MYSHKHYVPSLLQTVMVCSPKTNLFQYEVTDSSCNEIERYPYVDGCSVSVYFCKTSKKLLQDQLEQPAL